MSDPPMTSPTNWAGLAVVLLSAFTVLMQAYAAFSDTDAMQDQRLRNIEIILCVGADVKRQALCGQLGVMN
jgi:hypothetical protein